MIGDKARELGRLSGQSSEYQALKRASDALNEDKETVALLQQMEKLRIDAQRAMAKGERPTPEMEQQLDSLLGQIQGRSRSEEHTSELQSHLNLVCRLLLEKKKASRLAFAGA